jgi:hypothetical protein
MVLSKEPIMSKDDEPDPGGELPDWTPEQEKELDPVRLQRESLDLMKKFMAKMEKYEKGELPAPAAPLAPPAELVGQPPMGVGRRISMPKPPTFDEKKAQFKKAWEATKEIAPDGHYAVQCEIFRMLAHHIEYALPDDFEGEAAIAEGPTPPPA